MSHEYGSERKNRWSRRTPSPSNLRISPTGEYYSRAYNENQFIFPMSLPQSTPNTQQVVNNRHTSRSPLTESKRPTPISSLSSGGSRPNTAPFFGGSISDTQNSAFSSGSEGIAPFPPQHYPTIPRRSPQPQPTVHINPETGRVLTAADFTSRHPLSPPSSSSSESSSHSGRLSVGNFTQPRPQFLPPTSSTRPIPIPRANSRPDHPFTPQHPVPRPRRRRPHNSANLPPQNPSDWPPPWLQ